MALDQITSSRFIVPLGAFAALGVAVGVWLVPTSALDPESPGAEQIEEFVPPQPQVEYQEVPEHKAWLEAAAEMDTLREKVEEPEPEPEPGDPTGDGTGDPPGDGERPPSAIRLQWEYEGLVEHAQGTAALVRIQGEQRFVYAGQKIDDSTLPPGVEAVIDSVERDKIVVLIDGAVQEIERVDDAPPVRAPPQRSAGERGS